MKKMTLFLLAAVLPASASFASDYIGGGYYQKTTSNCNKAAIYRELDVATAQGRAVTTVVKCTVDAQKPIPAETREVRKARVAKPACGAECGTAFEKVIDREYYVRETREVYQPVVAYVSAGTYTTTKKVCESDFDC
ncbi:MAG: hypothetical protein LBF37_00090 [Rickettsiales bacterium]|nr:hypothetical protein [Rickettsiales bacterium]